MWPIMLIVSVVILLIGGYYKNETPKFYPCTQQDVDFYLNYRDVETHKPPSTENAECAAGIQATISYFNAHPALVDLYIDAPTPTPKIIYQTKTTTQTQYVPVTSSDPTWGNSLKPNGAGGYTDSYGNRCTTNSLGQIQCY